MTRRLRVLVVGPAGDGGIDGYIREQVGWLQDHVDVDVYRNYRSTTVDGPLSVLAWLLRTLIPMVRFPFRTRPDVVHVHASHYYSFFRASVYVFVASRLWRRPVVLHVHGSSFDEFLEDAHPAVSTLQRVVFAECDEVLVLSNGWKELLEPHVEDKTVTVLPNAVDPTTFDAGGAEGDPHVVFLSDLLERKGVDELLTAVDLVRDDADVEFQFSIAGRGPLESDAAAYAVDRPRTTYLGYVSESGKRELLTDGTVFVLPTHAEGLPIAMLEAMAAENAVVSTTVGSIPEMITDDHGLLVPPGDVEALAGAIETLVSDPGLAAAMGRANAELVRERFTWDAAGATLLDVYDELVESSVRRGWDGTSPTASSTESGRLR